MTALLFVVPYTLLMSDVGSVALTAAAAWNENVSGLRITSAGDYVFCITFI